MRVVVVTGAGRAFSAGTDLVELAANGDFRGTPADPERFERLIDALAAFPKPLVCAVNGVAVGIGATMLGLADLVVMADTARLRCPFTSLSLAPEAAASVTFPFLLGRQAAAWVLMSSEWVDAAEAKAMGLAWKVVPADDVLDEARALARRFAVHPLDSLVACKRLISATFAASIADGRQRENAEFDVLLETPGEPRRRRRVRVATEGPTMAEANDLIEENDVMVPMRDGVRLRADVFRPATGGPHPVLVHRYPYSTAGRVHGRCSGSMIAAQGYAVVVQSCRGRFGSEGDFYPIHPDVDDSYDTVEWAAAQPWSNGKVGMYGSSYSRHDAVDRGDRRGRRTWSASLPAYRRGTATVGGWFSAPGVLTWASALLWSAQMTAFEAERRGVTPPLPAFAEVAKLHGRGRPRRSRRDGQVHRAAATRREDVVRSATAAGHRGAC